VKQNALEYVGKSIDFCVDIGVKAGQSKNTAWFNFPRVLLVPVRSMIKERIKKYSFYDMVYIPLQSKSQRKSRAVALSLDTHSQYEMQQNATKCNKILGISQNIRIMVLKTLIPRLADDRKKCHWPVGKL
jgi:hypothetical protein